MWYISAETYFSSAHQLRGYSAECSELHGHNFKVKIVVETSELGPLGFGIDFKELKEKLKEAVKYFDHKNLNNLVEFSDINPSAENIAKVTWDKLYSQFQSPNKLKEVQVWESDTCSATYCEGVME